MPKPYKRKIMRKFRISEISGVDVPAQEGARALIMKRADATGNNPPSDARKNGTVSLVTGVTDGHQHGIQLSRYGDKLDLWVEYATGDGESGSHSHSLVKGDDDVYTVSENAGHTHTLDSAALTAAILDSVAKEDVDMTKEEQAALEAKVEKAQAQADRLGKIVALKAEHRSHFDTLDGTEAQDAFLAKSAAEMDAEIEAIRKRNDDADPVVYKTDAGVEIRKSDGATVLAMAKAQDESNKKIGNLEKENADLRSATSNANFEKRAATELKFLPGSLKSRAALLKAAEGIEDEGERKEALDALKAQNASLSHAFVTKGVSATGEVTDPTFDGGNDEAAMEKIANDLMKEDPKLSFASAYTKAMNSDAGQEILRKQEAAYREKPHIEAVAA